MDVPEEAVVAGAKGKREARVLKSRGPGFIVYGYFDLQTRRMEGKYSILLRNERGEVEHLFIVPSSGGKELVVKHETEKTPPKRKIWDRETGAVVEF